METNLYQEEPIEWITNWTYPEITMDSIYVTNTIQPLVIKHENPSTIRSVDFLILFLILLNIMFTWLNHHKK